MRHVEKSAGTLTSGTGAQLVFPGGSECVTSNGNSVCVTSNELSELLNYNPSKTVICRRIKLRIQLTILKISFNSRCVRNNDIILWLSLVS